ncbi:hypothetical protein [Sphingomonas sp. BK580]|uniref:hypothetical protein n=1 Tax=Sphingomonas sp. BK580 TaxID=2586972 RepID=UPI0016162588|nr:hypothetical protein [Sphingomonas sp. BK580]MBB3691473.1 hypothetical protein [Sphingomonas sp. BK580]
MTDNRDEGIRGQVYDLFRGARGGGPLPPNDGGGTSGGMTDDWKANVERELKQLHDDVRRLTGFIIAGAIAPFLAIIGLYVYNGSKFDTVNSGFEKVEARIVGVESKINAVAVQQAETRGDLKLLLERTAPKASK